MRFVYELCYDNQNGERMTSQFSEEEDGFVQLADGCRWNTTKMSNTLIPWHKIHYLSTIGFKTA